MERPLCLEKLHACIAAPVVTRFAPSPTGHLHLGHVVNAAWTWALACALDGAVVLRMEDHDRGRCRPEYEASILEDLAWLGLVAERGETELRAGGPCAFRQSDCAARYAAALAQLGAEVYGCVCSRKALAARVGQCDGEHAYDGHCRGLELPAGPPNGARVVLPQDEVRFDDLLLGPQSQHPAKECGDLLVRERNGSWSYQFCVVVDDAAHGVNLVVRGTDILASTGRQVLLARMLGGGAAPVYAHHPLVYAPDGHKLSKREASQGVRELRAEGRSAASVLGEAAWRGGLLEAARDLEATELGSLLKKK